MKKCPTCNKTFEDSMRFCQTDGTPLVDDEPAFDPYATIMAKPGEFGRSACRRGSSGRGTPIVSTGRGRILNAGTCRRTRSREPMRRPDDVLDLPAPRPAKDNVCLRVGDAGRVRTAEHQRPGAADPEPPIFRFPTFLHLALAERPHRLRHFPRNRRLRNRLHRRYEPATYNAAADHSIRGPGTAGFAELG